MDDGQYPLARAIASGIIQVPLEQAGGTDEWLPLVERMKLFDRSTNGRATLFLGSAISTFQPTGLPMWHQFVELIWSSLLQIGLQDQPESVGNYANSDGQYLSLTDLKRLVQ